MIELKDIVPIPPTNTDPTDWFCTVCNVTVSGGDDHNCSARYTVPDGKPGSEPKISRQLEWLRRERLDGDPLWTSAIGELSLEVNVPIGCPWAWEWCVLDANGIELARGDLMLDEPDDGTEWNYQGVINAERRCEGVARALLAEIPADKYVGKCIHIEQPFGGGNEEHPERTCLRCQAKIASDQVTETNELATTEKDVMP